MLTRVELEDPDPLFDQLGEFLYSDRMKAFRAAAARRCAGVADLMFLGKPVEELSPQFFDYLAFSMREEDGRTGLDLFLEEEGPHLAPRERAAFHRFREALFGLFVVEERVPEGARLRLAGTDHRFRVKAKLGPSWSTPGGGMVGRIVPYQDHHLLTGFPYPVDAETVSRVEPMLREAGPSARRAFADPVQFLEALKAGFLLGRAPENLRQAEVAAAPVFTETEFRFTVEEVKARFRSLDDPMKIFNECGLLRVGSNEQLQRLAGALVALWNHSRPPREGGPPPGKPQHESCDRGQEPVATSEIIFQRIEGQYGKIRVVPVKPGKAKDV